MSRYPITYKKVRHYHEPGDLHELTFSCFGRKPLLTNDTWRRFLAESLDRALEKHGWNLSAFVFMPEHVHLLVWPVNPSLGNVAGFLKTLKLSSSTRIKHHLMRNESTLLEQLRVRERAGKYVFRFWQEGPGFDRNVTSAEQAENVIDYIHRNPLRRELCERPEDWIWSSYRHYLQDDRYPPVEAPKWRPLTAQYLQGN